eukprot:287531_1
MQPMETGLKYQALEVDWDLGSEEEDIIDQVNGGDSTKSWNLGEDDETANISLQEKGYVNDDGTQFDCIHGRRLVYVCATMSSLSSILLGIDVGVMSGAKEYMTPDLGLNTVQEELIVGILNVIAAFGALVAGTVADYFGRKPTILLASILFLIGATMMVSSFGFIQMLIGRILTGLGVGCAMMIAPVYTAEIAPPDVRGMLVSLTDIAINLGILLGFAWSEAVDSFVSSDSARWRIMLGIGIIPPIFIILCLAIMPESPRWLVIKGRKNDSLNILQRICESKYEAKELLESISKSVEAHHEEKPTWRNILFPEHKAMQRVLVIAVMLGICQQISGTEAAVYYTPEILKEAGWNESQVLVGTIYVGVCKLGGEILAFLLLDRVGRRPLFIFSSTFSTFFLVLLGLTFTYAWSGSVALLWLCMFLASFSIGLGPGTFVVASEIVPLSARSKTMGVVICVNRLASGIIAISFVSMMDTFTLQGTFHIFAVLSCMSVFFYALCVPETLGQTLEQVTEVMDELVDDDGIISSQNEQEGTTNAKLDANSSPGSEGLHSNTRIIELRQMNE